MPGQAAVDTTTTPAPAPTTPDSTPLYVGAGIIGLAVLGAVFFAFGESSSAVNTSPNPRRRRRSRR